ncbi:MAG: hypothetical protein IJW03_02530 [Clostridia bacterium]|nr:hypothetical protein [Clostridia bacterium]
MVFCIFLTACGLVTQEDIDNAVNSTTADLNAQIAAIEADIAEKTARIATLEAEKTELGADVEELDAEVAALKTEKVALEAKVEALKAEKSELEAENEALKNCLAGKHNGGTATCVSGKICENCETAYGDVDTENHVSDEFTYIDNGDGTHDYGCDECGYAEVDNDEHTFVDDVCACGNIGYSYDEATNTYTVYTHNGLTTALANGGNIILGDNIEYTGTATNNSPFIVLGST